MQNGRDVNRVCEKTRNYFGEKRASRALTSLLKPIRLNKLRQFDEERSVQHTMAQKTEAAMLMTEGSIARKLVKFALPAFWGNLFQQLYNIVDSLVVGNLLGSEALAAVGSSGSLIFLIVGFFYGAFSGAGVVVSRFFGAKDDENVSRAVHTTVALGVISGITVSIVGVLLAPQILLWMGTPEDVLPNSLTYLRIYFGGVITTILYNTVSGIMQAVGDSKHPLYYLIVSSAINVVLTFFLWGRCIWALRARPGQR